MKFTAVVRYTIHAGTRDEAEALLTMAVPADAGSVAVSEDARVLTGDATLADWMRLGVAEWSEEAKARSFKEPGESE